MTNAALCPARSELERLLLGQLAEADAEFHLQHLAVCAVCMESLEVLEAGHLALKDLRAASNHLLLADPRAQSLIERLLSKGPSESAIANETTGTAIPRDGDALDARCHAQDPHARRFGRYALQRILGKGGMGAVYLAWDSQLERPVALKIPRFGAHTRAADEERFLREARAAATLSHPNICPVYDAGRIEGVSFLAMAYVEGKNLAELLRDQPRRPTAEAVRLVRDLALAMEEAHRRGVIHRDLKPANVMIDSRGQPVIMDFGLARRDQDKGDAQLTKSGVVMGTPAYMPPEQINCDVHAMGPACDVYSLGVILFELLTGRLPFTGPLGSLLAQIMSVPATPPSQYCSELDVQLDEICLTALEKIAANRFASMQDFASALDRWQPQSARSAPIPSPAKLKSAKRSDVRPRSRVKSGRSPKSSRAQAAYHKARHFWSKRTEEGLRKSIEYFNQALDQAPDFALAWAGLADAYHQLGHWGLAPPGTAYPRGKSAALKAIELDGSLTEAHLALAVILKDYDWEFASAERAFRLALEQEPNHASGHQWYGQCLACMGKHPEAITELSLARKLDPLALIHDAVLGRHGYFFARQYDRAREQLQHTLSTDPNFWIAQNFLGWVLFFQGEISSGLAAMERARDLDDNPENLVGLGYGHALANQPTKAQSCIEALRARASHRYVAPINFALIYAALREMDQAFTWLDQACDDHSEWLSEILVDPAFDPVRRDPRFEALILRMDVKTRL